ncbi:Pectate lyase [Abortiporus biennis]
MLSNLFSFITLATVLTITTTFATPLTPRAVSCTFPSLHSTSSLSSAKTIVVEMTFDGENVRFDYRSRACKGQTEGGDSDAVFLVEKGATIQNVVIGANQAKGIHYLGSCTLKNVWFEDVCKDAITI